MVMSSQTSDNLQPNNSDKVANDHLSDRRELEQRLNLAVQRNGNRTVLFTNAIAQHIGLSATEFECVSLLSDEGPLTAGQLGAACGLSSGGVTGLVNRLVKAGFVTRERDPKDRRRVIISAKHNEEARRIIIGLYRPVAEAFDQLLVHFSDAQLRAILEFHDRTDAMAAAILDDMRRADRSDV